MSVLYRCCQLEYLEENKPTSNMKPQPFWNCRRSKNSSLGTEPSSEIFRGCSTSPWSLSQNLLQPSWRTISIKRRKRLYSNVSCALSTTRILQILWRLIMIFTRSWSSLDIRRQYNLAWSAPECSTEKMIYIFMPNTSHVPSSSLVYVIPCHGLKVFTIINPIAMLVYQIPHN